MATLDKVKDGSAKKLIEEMIKLKPQERPSSKYVAKHPTFWDDEKRSRFIQAISDLITAKDEKLKAAVNVDPTRVLGEEQGKPKDWRKIINLSSLEKDPKRQRSYKETTSELLRLVRNKLHHFDEVPEEGRRMVGDTRSGLVDYIIDKFPLLLVLVWEAAKNHREKRSICLFYTGNDIVKVGLSTIILRDGFGLSELTELRSSRETLERLSVAATDLSQLEKHLPKGLRRINVRGEVPKKIT
ncbi:serine/threonine-protein kinase/endoribonuclease IRE1-like [Amphibalanus amphitrite]|uniref:serine/threonine-protein kinase/endoribonuclease IRE1-like n=1 Tax=Amphibalanus amphitrite TaxID=1232801 RepID=UPI001C90C225|nr:serine/threonine-protein kinase/endoribonuclease IRE1-like [Amphibalanus amphitrite]